MKVKCINGTYSDLELDEIYEVLEENPLNYVVQGKIAKLGWAKSRFVIVEDDLLTATQVMKSATIKAPIAKSKVDVEEEKCWRAMRPNDPPGFCPCGTHRSVCWIHKDN